jgi:hypothetical protein
MLVLLLLLLLLPPLLHCRCTFLAATDPALAHRTPTTAWRRCLWMTYTLGVLAVQCGATPR